MWSALAALFMPLGLLNGTSAGHTWRVAEALESDVAAQRFDVVEQQRYQHLVSALTRRAVSGDGAKDLVATATDLGLDLEIGAKRFELRPASPESREAGILVLRRGHLSAEVVVTAPHPFDDRDSGWVAAQIFDQSPVRAVYIATAAPLDTDDTFKSGSQRRSADLSANADTTQESAILLATRGLSQVLSEPWYVQIQTFDMRSAEPAIVVDSAGTDTSRGDLELAADRLCVALNGVDVRTSRYTLRLAAQDNAQLDALESSTHFLIVGLSSGYSA
ncbi:MAG: hypothetical protein GXP62_02900, partial [Oligoflexia bacterium]|nr:hypothetical protein [Oligoflexia bacterium]